jgi:hypothetical protein
MSSVVENHWANTKKIVILLVYNFRKQINQKCRQAPDSTWIALLNPANLKNVVKILVKDHCMHLQVHCALVIFLTFD